MYEKELDQKPQENWEPTLARREMWIMSAIVLLLGCILMLGFCVMMPAAPVVPAQVEDTSYNVLDRRVDGAFATDRTPVGTEPYVPPDLEAETDDIPAARVPPAPTIVEDTSTDEPAVVIPKADPSAAVAPPPVAATPPED